MPKHADIAESFAREWGFDGVIFHTEIDGEEYFAAAVRNNRGSLDLLYDKIGRAHV